MVLDTYFTKEDKFGLPRSEKLKPDKSVFPKLDLPLEEFALALAGEYRTFLEMRGYQNQPFQIYLVGSRAVGTHKPNSDYDINLSGPVLKLEGQIDFILALHHSPRMRTFLPEQSYWAILDIRQEEVQEGRPFRLLGEFC